MVGLLLAGGRAEAEDFIKEYNWGAQVGAAVPTSRDLRITTRGGLSPSLGIHLTWAIDEYHSLRPRLDFWSFGEDQQEVTTPLVQKIETRVQGLTLGLEYVRHFGSRHERWSAGAGAYLIRWSVKSTNGLTFPGGGIVQATGTSDWLRPGLGLLGGCRITQHLQLEVRWISSRYGYEDLPAHLGTAGLLWNF
jgi:hypothetical protein